MLVSIVFCVRSDDILNTDLILVEHVRIEPHKVPLYNQKLIESRLEEEEKYASDTSRREPLQ